jgi:hypothetical protein
LPSTCDELQALRDEATNAAISRFLTVV